MAGLNRRNGKTPNKNNRNYKYTFRVRTPKGERTVIIYAATDQKALKMLFDHGGYTKNDLIGKYKREGPLSGDE